VNPLTRHALSLCAAPLLAASLVALAPAPVAAQSGAPPRVEVDPDSRDLGVVGLGEEAVAEFVLRNTGGAPLTLTVPRPPQGIEVEGVVAEVPPGESVRVRVRVDTLRAQAERRQESALVTNDPDRPRVTLVVQLDVRPFLRVRPGHARFITHQHAREGTIAQTVGAVDGASFRVLRADSPMPSLRVTFREARPEEREPAWTGSQWRVEATLASDSPVGALTGYIMVHTDHPRQRRAFVPVSGFVRPMLAVTPPEARLGDLDRRRTTPVRLLVKSFAEGAIQITGVSTDVAAVRAEIEPVEPGRTWRLKLLPVPDAPLGPFQGTLRLRTAIPELPSVEVPLSGRLVEASPPATP
jgi:hypothetical protein